MGMQIEREASAGFRSVLGNPQLRNMPLGASTVGKRLNRQIRFELLGDGSFAQRVWRPETQAARELLTGRHGTAMQQVLRGIALMADDAVSDLGGPQMAKLQGVAISRYWDDDAANYIVALDESGGLSNELRGAAASEVATIANKIARGRASRPPVGSMTEGGWMLLSPPIGAPLLQHVTGATEMHEDIAARLVQTVVHEIEHAVTPARVEIDEFGGMLGGGAKPLVRLEESVAEMGGRDADRLNRAAHALELPAAPAAIERLLATPHSYDRLIQPFVDALAAGGIDYRESNIRQLMQRTPLRDVGEGADRMARAILERSALPLTAQNQQAVRARVINMLNNGLGPDSLKHWLNEQRQLKHGVAAAPATPAGI